MVAQFQYRESKPQFAGGNFPLSEFSQDVAKDAVHITEATEPGFIKIVLSKLKGVARKIVRDKRFNRVNNLMTQLTKRWTSGTRVIKWRDLCREWCKLNLIDT